MNVLRPQPQDWSERQYRAYVALLLVVTVPIEAPMAIILFATVPGLLVLLIPVHAVLTYCCLVAIELYRSLPRRGRDG